MSELPNLHDGFFDGVLVFKDKTARFFVRTVDGERSTIVLTDVEALNIGNIRDGNIILDVVVVVPSAVTVEHIEQAYDLQQEQKDMSRRLLQGAKQKELSALEINPSYGAQGTVLFRNLSILADYVFA